MFLMIDNYDSFTYNIIQYFNILGEKVDVIRNDDDINKIDIEKYTGLILSPGPSSPDNSGITLDAIKRFTDVPTLGICLGLQALVYSYGGKVVKAKNTMHGKSDTITHDGSVLFKNVPKEFKAIRYHSLAAEKSSFPEMFSISAVASDGEVMAISHKERPIYGVQYHPESYLTEHGLTVIKNFITIAYQKKGLQAPSFNDSLNIKQILQKSYKGEILTLQESEEVFSGIFNGKLSEIELAAFVTALKVRGENPVEVIGAVRSLRQAGKKLKLGNKTTFDTCGTGGDHSGSFNISTTVALMLATIGVPVTKHGNRSVSGKSGSTDFLDALKIPTNLTDNEAREYFQKNSFIYMAAPNYHPAMRYAVPVRQAMATRTIFNLLGPLANPADSKRQAIGLFSPEIIPLYLEAISQLDYDRVVLYSSEDGMDEVSPSAPTKVVEYTQGVTKTFTINPRKIINSDEVNTLPHNATASEHASILMELLNKPANTPLARLLAINFALAYYAFNAQTKISENYNLGLQLIMDGRLLNKVNQLRNI